MSDREREADDDRSGATSTTGDDRPPRRSVADRDRSPGESSPDTAGESGPDATGESGSDATGGSSGTQSADDPEREDGRERPPPPPIDREHPSPENVVFFLLGVLVALVTLARLLGGAV